jgi:hypothetical protein
LGCAFPSCPIAWPSNLEKTRIVKSLDIRLVKEFIFNDGFAVSP